MELDSNTEWDLSQAVELLAAADQEKARKAVKWLAENYQISDRMERSAPTHKQISEKLQSVSDKAKALRTELKGVDNFADEFLFCGADDFLNADSERARMLSEAGLLDDDCSFLGNSREHKIFRQLTALARIASSSAADAAKQIKSGPKNNAASKNFGAAKFQLAMASIEVFEEFRGKATSTTTGPFCGFVKHVYAFAAGKEWEGADNAIKTALNARGKICVIDEEIGDIKNKLKGLGWLSGREVEEKLEALYKSRDALMRGR